MKAYWPIGAKTPVTPKQTKDLAKAARKAVDLLMADCHSPAEVGVRFLLELALEPFDGVRIYK